MRPAENNARVQTFLVPPPYPTAIDDPDQVVYVVWGDPADPDAPDTHLLSGRHRTPVRHHVPSPTWTATEPTYSASPARSPVTRPTSVITDRAITDRAITATTSRTWTGEVDMSTARNDPTVRPDHLAQAAEHQPPYMPPRVAVKRQRYAAASDDHPEQLRQTPRIAATCPQCRGMPGGHHDDHPDPAATPRDPRLGRPVGALNVEHTG